MAGDHHRGDERKKQNVPAAELQPRERICRERGDRDHTKRHRDGQKHRIDRKLIKGQHLEQALVVLHRERPGPQVQRITAVKLLRGFERGEQRPDERIDHDDAEGDHEDVVYGVAHGLARGHAKLRFFHAHSPPCSWRKRYWISVTTMIMAKNIHASADA